jgi:4-hydroxyphenylacetate 3-monooxygenase/4-hydroxybutyryl-CoA dehydratase/vinylacetyl-CoA-Delta-isomerase
MKTAEEYRQSLYKMKPNIFINGEQVNREDPRLQGTINVISETFNRVDDPEFKDLLTATSHLTNEPINRFTHIHQSTEDLLKKQEMTRRICRYCGGCIFRCMGVDSLNGLSIVTHKAETASTSRSRPLSPSSGAS